MPNIIQKDYLGTNGGLFCLDCKEFHSFAPKGCNVVNVIWTMNGYVLKHDT